MSISLSKVLSFSNFSDFKVHLASSNGSSEPLDVFVRDRSEWKKWNMWRSSRDDFNRCYIFSLIDFYPESNTWLFGGIFEVLSRSSENRTHSYEVELSNKAEEFVGRLKVRFERPGRIRAIKFGKYVEDMTVSEITRNSYNGESFSGFENICHGFNELENIFLNRKKDWKAALQNVKGVYLIVDQNNGKSYVGAAYGEYGIWSRWRCYISTGHGWNDELTRVIKERGKEYARQNFQFTLLEYMPARTDDSTIIERESFWKRALLSRNSEFGYNQN